MNGAVKLRKSTRKSVPVIKIETDTLERADTKKPIACSNCNKEFRTKKNLTAHKKQCNNNNNNNVDTEEALKSEIELDKEMVPKKNGDKRTEYICYSCGLVCKDMLTYNKHCKSHTSRVANTVVQKYAEMFDVEPPKECPICHREQKGARQTWLRHLNTHNSDVMMYFCGVCRKGFRRVDHMRDHEKRHVVKLNN